MFGHEYTPRIAFSVLQGPPCINRAPSPKACGLLGTRRATSSCVEPGPCGETRTHTNERRTCWTLRMALACRCDEYRCVVHNAHEGHKNVSMTMSSRGCARRKAADWEVR